MQALRKPYLILPFPSKFPISYQSLGIAGVAELADAPDLGSNVYMNFIIKFNIL